MPRRVKPTAELTSLSTWQAAQELGYSNDMVRRLIADGKLRATRPRTHYRIHIDDLRAYAQTQGITLQRDRSSDR